MFQGTGRENDMAMQDIGHTITKPLFNWDADSEFEAGLAKLMPFVRALAQSLSRTRELAEDLAQEALTKAWQSRRSFSPGSNLKAWLFTILRNEFYSHQRRAWRQIPLDEELAATIPAPSDEQEWAVELSDAASAMRKLPDIHRDALILVAGGFSYEDAAVLLRSPVGTVKSRVGRARKSLKENLERRTVLPVESRGSSGNATNYILAQLSHLSRIDTPRAGVGTAIH
jgi:RNA polymerase sigma-70 factor, ECF subfamily